MSSRFRNLALRIAVWRHSRQSTTCLNCRGPLPRHPVERRYCSDACCEDWINSSAY